MAYLPPEIYVGLDPHYRKENGAPIGIPGASIRNITTLTDEEIIIHTTTVCIDGEGYKLHIKVTPKQALLVVRREARNVQNCVLVLLAPVARTGSKKLLLRYIGGR